MLRKASTPGTTALVPSTHPRSVIAEWLLAKKLYRGNEFLNTHLTTIYTG